MRPGRLLAASFAALLAVPSAVHAAGAPPITLAVDARQAPQKTFHTHEIIPVSPGTIRRSAWTVHDAG